MSSGKTIYGFYTTDAYMGWSGESAWSLTSQKYYRSRGYFVKDNKVFQKFESEAAYVDWWQDRFSGKEIDIL